LIEAIWVLERRDHAEVLERNLGEKTQRDVFDGVAKEIHVRSSTRQPPIAPMLATFQLRTARLRAKASRGKVFWWQQGRAWRRDRQRRLPCRRMRS
jgi:hypothetical protein